MYSYFMSAFVMLGVLMAPAGAAETIRESVAVTASCDADESEKTTDKLLAWVEHEFARFAAIHPVKDRVSVEPMSELDGPLTEFHDAVFRDFRAEFIRESDGSRVFAALSTRSPRFRLPWGLALGQSMQKVQAILGPPSAIGPRALLYESNGIAVKEVLFTFDRDRLVEVSWTHGQAD